MNQTVNKQIDFFASTDIVALLKKWLTELFSIIQNVDLRLQALYVYRVLVNLAMYIACIQKEDSTTAKVPMAGIFNLIIKHLQTLRRLAANFSPEEKTQLLLLKNNVEDELQRVINNNEDQAKPQVVDAYKKMIDIITAIFGT